MSHELLTAEIIAYPFFRAKDILAFKRTSEAAKKEQQVNSNEASHSAILGPFYRHGVPVQPNGTTIVRQFEKDADYTRLFGQVFDSEGKPIKGATVDIWHDVSPDSRRPMHIAE